jgi:hypothetical protein
LMEFTRRLQDGGRLVRTSKFNLHMPTDPSEINVMGWLEDTDRWDALCAKAQGRMGPERIAKVIFAFYNRLLVDIAPG